MSLSARIALEPSRGLASLERSLAGGGIAVATAAAASRWSEHSIALVACGAAALVLLFAFDVFRRRRTGRCMLVVGDRLEVGLLESGVDDDGASWQLVEPTMMWPALAMVALAKPGSNRRRVIPVATGALAPFDRRALARFLMWSLRSGQSSHDGSTQ